LNEADRRIEERLKSLPGSPGVYFMRDAKAAVIYIGKATHLKKRVSSYFTNRALHDPKLSLLVPKIRHIDYIPCASEREALILEQKLIRREKPAYNTMWRDDKSFPYVALTWQEDFPRIYFTRAKKRDGTLYYGPYPNSGEIKNILRWAWKEKVFPLRPCRYEFDAKHLPPYSKVRSCLYLHTGECSAPCVGKINPARYRRIARKARLFFEGSQETLTKQMEAEMKRASRKMRFEEAAKLRDRINAMARMRQPVTFKEITPEQVTGRIEIAQTLTDLMRALGLPRPPLVIETFDISHVQGTEMVGSMVSFERGRPNKSGYRKFLIRSVSGIDDFQAMREVVGRRYKRIALERGRWPDLILIDGGKGQLNAALEALDSITSQPPPVAAIAKEEELIFMPGRAEPVRLPRDSPALHIIQRARDEAHRFAITFHRKRRGKKMVA
jgi:excinuclease ABC subunit C